MHISQAEVESVSLDRLSPASPEEFFAPKQHYKLLALLAKKLGPDAHFIDVGTHLGDSARALSAYGNQVTSFDVESRVTKNVFGDSSGSLEIADLWNHETRSAWRDWLLSSALIFIDIDPHEGKRELEFVRWLQFNDYKGLIVLDDIWFFKPMRDNCWHRIESYYKVDATLLGHWSGTGIVSFDERVSVAQDEDTSNWTLVTGYFDLTNRADANDAIRARPQGHYIDEHGASLLSTDQNLIVFCDHGLEEKIWNLRPRWLHAKTRVVAMSFEEFSTTQYLEKIIENRGNQGACGRDPRNTASYYLFCMARYGMLQRAIENNPFRSTHFAWINICIERMGFNNLIHLPGALAVNRDEFSTCWIDYVSKETTEDLARHFGPNGCRDCEASCTMCSGFFTGRSDYMNEVCGLLIREFERCVQLGYGHADEQLFPIVYYKNPNLFRWYIGDYAEMITNYEYVRERPEQPLRNLIRNSYAAGDTEACKEACSLLAESIELGHCSLSSPELETFNKIRGALDGSDFLFVNPAFPHISIASPKSTEAEYRSWTGGHPEAELIESIKSEYGDPGGTFIDIGAHCGIWTTHMSLAFSRVFAFEPHPVSFARLQRSVAESRVPRERIHLFNVALGADNKSRTLRSLPGGNLGDSSFAQYAYETSVNTETVEVARISDILRAFVGPISLIKIDVEGFEKDVLEGAVDFLVSYGLPPILLESWSDPNRGQAPFSETSKVLTDIGYDVQPMAWPEMYLAKKKPVTKTLFVTAFFRLDDRPVDEAAQVAHFDRLAQSGVPIVLFLDDRIAIPERYGENVTVISASLEWLLGTVRPRIEFGLPSGRTSGKDTEQFLLLQNAKLQLLEEARLQFDATHYAWIDFAIMKISAQPTEFAERLRQLSDNPRPGNSTPGCWETNPGANQTVNWRFCGGLIVIAAENVAPLASKNRRLLARSDVLTWEVNNWAKLERDGVDFGWYKADHDDSILGGNQ